MIPLCTTAKRPVQSMCGCAFASEGRPWVAQRVWPRPVVPCSASPLRRRAAKLASFPSALDPGGRAVGVDRRDPAGVVPAVLEPGEGIHDDRDAVALADVTDDAAHG